MNTNTTGKNMLTGRRLVLARVLWLGMVALSLGIYFTGTYYRQVQLRQLCPGPACPNADLTPRLVQALADRGLSATVYLNFNLVVGLIMLLTNAMLGGLIFWRRSRDRMALLISLFLIMLGTFFSDASETLAALHPAWWLPTRLFRFVATMGLFLCCYLFPDGRFVPRWTRWVTLVIGLGAAGAHILPGTALDPGRWLPQLPAFVLFLAVLLSLVFAQVYRFRRVSGPVQRQQSKWVVLGIAVAIAVFFGTLIATNSVLRFDRAGIVGVFIGSMLFASTLLIVPLSIGLAILRSHLWDIDRLINRALVYGLLTAILVLVYGGIVVLLQQTLRVTTGEHGDAEVVAATLVIAALFHPLRRRIQSGIDRRFYRRKYDAGTVLATFSARLRDEVDLSTVMGELLDVVEEAMQPAHVSLWIQSFRRPQTG